MNLLIADTFTSSLAKLTGQEQKAVKQTAFDLQLNPEQPSHSFHKLDRAKDKNFWSVRVNRDIRIIVHRTSRSLLLAYVDHHDDAYAWAERRRLETHPKTGAAQIVEVRERVEEVTPTHSATASKPGEPDQPPPFNWLSRDDLLNVGVPRDWVPDVLEASEDEFLDLADHLPAEAAEALLNYVSTGALEVPEQITADARTVAYAPALDASDERVRGAATERIVEPEAFQHPDAQRRFRVMANVEELEQALEYPWERWTVFLHPAQRVHVDRRYAGPARISGSAGTGKTVVALHRAVELARGDLDAQVLLTTFSKGLAHALGVKLRRLTGDASILERIHVRPIRQVGYDAYAAKFGQPQIASPARQRALIAKARHEAGVEELSEAFLLTEWRDVVDAWGLRTWEAYRDVPRLGRKTRLGPKQREAAWSVMEALRVRLKEAGLVTWSDVFHRVIETPGALPDFRHAVIDEAQDVSVAELRFLAAMSGDRADGLFFAGDLGQRIFQAPFSWRSLGVDVRGRSSTLRVNYRTSHQIRTAADRLLPSAVQDADGDEEDRRGTVSIFNGPPPRLEIFEDEDAEIDGVSDWLKEQTASGVAPEEIGVFVRTETQLARARKAVRATGLEPVELDDAIVGEAGKIAVATMHWAKGLEFKAVAVMACDDEVIPLQERVETVSDESDLLEVYETERHLLYVACTRARDSLLVSGVDPATEFFDDFG
ncbi:DNA helicase [Marinicauda salina]|uniref:DNA 3'-5' helicase n=1 Tax=Marinicauda salina TaxID=2135793 RepID=A0A2U2BT00_9PROT|nr:3'-5' exonuclease [Marinicauda salina]PWE17131.1 DNA helicase [Marinicauda salina]